MNRILEIPEGRRRGEEHGGRQDPGGPPELLQRRAPIARPGRARGLACAVARRARPRRRGSGREEERREAQDAQRGGAEHGVALGLCAEIPLTYTHVCIYIYIYIYIQRE